MMLRRMLALALFLLLGSGAPAADDPFAWSLGNSGGEAVVSVTVAPAYYFGADSLMISVTGADGKAATPDKTTAEQLFVDEFSPRKFCAGRHEWRFRGVAPFTAEVSWQGCREAEDGKPALCLAPDVVTLGGTTPVKKIEAAIESADFDYGSVQVRAKRDGVMSGAEFIAFLRSGAASEEEESSPLAGRGVVAVVLLVLLGGAALNLTPCVLPMIPVNLAIIGADGGKGRRTGLRRGLLYGGGMAAAYGCLGVLAVFAGVRFGQLNSTPWFNFAVAAVFFVLALGMFGVFNLDFSRLGSVRASRIPGGPGVAALLLGALAALLAGACVAPVVISVLLLSAQLYNDGVRSAAALPFLLGIGMALPWVLAGAGLDVLPKPGRFMIAVKNIFGVLILLMAGYYGWIGWSLLPGKFSPEAELSRLEAGVSAARESGKPVLVDFWATWCKNCKAMEQVMREPEVKNELSRFEVVKFQAEKPGDPAIAALLDKWKIGGLPSFVILDVRRLENTH